MAVSLRLTVADQNIQEAMPSTSTVEAQPQTRLSDADGKPEAFRYVLRQSREYTATSVSERITSTE
jgi:hypothetical protein